VAGTVQATDARGGCAPHGCVPRPATRECDDDSSARAPTNPSRDLGPLTVSPPFPLPRPGDAPARGGIDANASTAWITIGRKVRLWNHTRRAPGRRTAADLSFFRKARAPRSPDVCFRNRARPAHESSRLSHSPIVRTRRSNRCTRGPSPRTKSRRRAARTRSRTLRLTAPRRAARPETSRRRSRRATRARRCGSSPPGPPRAMSPSRGARAPGRRRWASRRSARATTGKSTRRRA
jgi:hypothetical protein